MTLGKDHFADKRCADRALPRVPLGKGFAESRIAFAESLWLSAKPPYAVVFRCKHLPLISCNGLRNSNSINNMLSNKLNHISR